MLTVKVKWGKEVYEVDVDTSAPATAFKQKLQSLTNVPADRQKIMGVKGGQLKDDADMSAVGLSASKPLMLIGSAEAAPEKPKEAMTFAEDMVNVGHTSNEVMSNGLVNMGNTCYMNSVLQSLRVVPELRPRLESASNNLARSLAGLYNQLDSTREPVPPALVWTSLMAQNPEFAQTSDQGMPMQHDAQEALTTMLDASGEMQSEAPLFRGKTRDTAGNEENFTMLRCHIGQDVQILEAGLEKSMGEGESARKLSELPPYLLVHMARFAWRNDTKENAKVLRPVAFQQVMDVSQLCTSELKAKLEEPRRIVKDRRDAEMARKRSGEPAPAAAADGAEKPDDITGFYELAGVVSHKGRTLDGGHYIAWAKKAGEWLVFDDDKVARVTEDDVNRLRGVGEAHIAYVLLYRARDPDTGFSPVA